MGDKPTEITPINPEPQTQASPTPARMLQTLVNQFGLSPPQAQAYIDTVAHPSHSVAQGNVVTAAKLRMAQQVQQANLMAERDRMLQGMPSQREIARRDTLQADFPSRDITQSNADNKAIGASHDLRALAESYARPIDEIQMPAVNAHTGVEARPVSTLGPRRRSAGTTPPAPGPSPDDWRHENWRQRLAAFEQYAQRGAREGMDGTQHWTPGAHPPALHIGDVNTQAMPLDVGDVSVTTAQPSLDIGNVTVTPKRK